MTTIPASFTYAVEVASEIVDDGAAEFVTPEHIRLAREALAGSRSNLAITALGEAVALGAEYLCTVQDPDDGEMIAALQGFERPHTGHGDAADCWRQYMESGSSE